MNSAWPGDVETAGCSHFHPDRVIWEYRASLRPLRFVHSSFRKLVPGPEEQEGRTGVFNSQFEVVPLFLLFSSWIFEAENYAIDMNDPPFICKAKKCQTLSHSSRF